jgi:hypothetical protein
VVETMITTGPRLARRLANVDKAICNAGIT